MHHKYFVCPSVIHIHIAAAAAPIYPDVKTQYQYISSPIDFCCSFRNTCNGDCGVKCTNLCVCCTFTCNARLHSVNANLCVWLLACHPPEHLQVTVIQN